MNLATVDIDACFGTFIDHKEFNDYMVWQNTWGKKCSRLCCYAENCGDIKCSFCCKSMLRQPYHRFFCLDCLAGATSKSSVANDLHEVGGVDLCYECFQGELPHIGEEDGEEHLRYLSIDIETGEHVGVIRSVPEGTTLAPLTVKHLTPIPGFVGNCVCCDDDLNDTYPGYALPGCIKPIEHSPNPFCSTCLLDSLLKQKKFRKIGDTVYLPPPSYFCHYFGLSCSRDIEEGGIRSEYNNLKERFEQWQSNTIEEKTTDFSNVSTVALSFLFSCPSLKALENAVSGKALDDREKLLKIIEQHPSSKSKNYVDLTWDDVLKTFFKEAMKSAHPQKHLMELVDSF